MTNSLSDKSALVTRSRAAVAGLALLAVPRPIHANRIQDPHQERKVAMTMKDDLANRSRESHWPHGFDPTTADLFSHNELLVRTTCERVRQHIVEAAKWPEWYPNWRSGHSGQ